MPQLIAQLDLFGVVMTIVGLGGLIFFHELGHFIACRLTGTRVEAFSVGFGKEIIGWTRGHTRYRVGIVPLGGYVKMAAENPGEVNTGAPDEFPNKSFAQRLFIMSNGVIFNIILAFALFVWAFGIGVPFQRAEIGMVVPGGPAWRSGLRVGDLVTHVDGRQVLGFEDLHTEIAFSGAGEELMLTLVRDGDTLEVPVVPEYSEERGMPAIQVAPAFSDAALSVTADSPVAKAGGRAGDTVVSIGGFPIDGMLDVRDVTVRLAGRAPADASRLDLAVRVKRADGAVEDLAVALPLAKRRQVGILQSEGRKIAAIAGHARFAEILRLGDEIVSVNDADLQDLSLLRDAALPVPLAELTIVRENNRIQLTDLGGLNLRDLIRSIRGKVSAESNRVVARADMPAARAGLLTGDRIVKVDDKATKTWAAIVGAVTTGKGDTLRLQVERAGEQHTLTVVPGRYPSDKDPLLGYETGAVMTPHQETSVFGALRTGWRRTTLVMESVLLTIRSLLTARVDSKHIGGPIMLAQITYTMFDQGWGRYLYILALISINLAILNILPIPVLDGGQIVLLCAEKLRGKPLPERFVGYYQMVGLVLILGLVILVFRNDITRLLE